MDANVLAPGFTGKGSLTARLLDLWRSGTFRLVLSEHVLQELERALADPYFAARLCHEQRRSGLVDACGSEIVECSQGNRHGQRADQVRLAVLQHPQESHYGNDRICGGVGR